MNIMKTQPKRRVTTIVELPIGTRFYYHGRLWEVVEAREQRKECVIYYIEGISVMCVAKARQDGKNVCFKWIEDQEENDEVK